MASLKEWQKRAELLLEEQRCILMGRKVWTYKHSSFLSVILWRKRRRLFACVQLRWLPAAEAPERLDASVACRLPALSHHFALAPACSTLSDLMCYCTLNRQDRSRHAERPNASRATIIVIRQSVITPPWLFLFPFQTNFWESRQTPSWLLLWNKFSEG